MNIQLILYTMLVLITWTQIGLAQEKPVQTVKTYKTVRKSSKLTFTASQSIGDTVGKFNAYSVTLTYKDDDIEKSSIDVQMAANSINTNSSGRDEHLKNEDFFDVKKHKYVKFQSTKITKLKGDVIQVRGNLTIKNKKTPVVFNATLTWSKDKSVLRAKGALVVDRFKVGLNYKGPFYTPSIKKNIKINLNVALKAQ